MIRRRLSSALLWFAVAVVLVPVVAPACSSKDEKSRRSNRSNLPPLTFDAETPKLSITWIDGRGDAHVVSSPTAVPKEQAKFVRVVVEDSEDGAIDPIYVADVSTPDESGSFTARPAPRSEWEAEIDRRRKDPDGKAMVTKANDRKPPPAPPPPANPPPSSSAAPSPSIDIPKKLDPRFVGLTVIVYGASWCGPCHQAIDHLRKRGVKSIFRNIETEDAARAEMTSKLEKAGGRRGSIPVIDIGGQIIVGYSAGDIDRALRKAGSGTAL